MEEQLRIVDLTEKVFSSVKGDKQKQSTLERSVAEENALRENNGEEVESRLGERAGANKSPNRFDVLSTLDENDEVGKENEP